MVQNGQRSLAKLQSTGSQRVGHDLDTEHARAGAHTHTHTHLDNIVLQKDHRYWNQIVLGPTLTAILLSWVIMEGY